MMNFQSYSNLTGVHVGKKVRLSDRNNFANAFNNLGNLTSAYVYSSDMEGADTTFGECRNLKYSGLTPNMTNMYRAYFFCFNLTGHPVCGPEVTNMYGAYHACYNITGNAVCGNNVRSMEYAYYACHNLSGNPACGVNVTTMNEAYMDCRNLTGSPVCGDSVIHMVNTYALCYNLTGSPVCGPNVVNMHKAYSDCYNLTGSPVCGNKVKDMSYAYYYCKGLRGAPISGPNVTNMKCTYNSCFNLVGSPVSGPNVTDMSCTYYACQNLTGSPVCGINVVNMSQTYDGCTNITGKPVCGPNVTDMSYAYNYCYRITGSPVCGPNVTNMARAYNSCNNITGSPVCGSKVVDMINAYYACSNLTGAPACGANVTNMFGAYRYCYNITGSPACGSKVTNMAIAYHCCNNMTGSPVCTNSVINMYGAYAMCNKLTGSPKCGANVTNLHTTYLGCHNLTGSPVCGSNVVDMTYAYDDCYNITGNPVCGANVTNMPMAYSNCYNLTGAPVCGNKVINMREAYVNCRNITGSPVCGPNVTDMHSAYENCYKISGSPVCGRNVIDMQSAYHNCQNLTGAAVIGSNVTNASYAYMNCKNITSGILTSKLTGSSGTYSDCTKLGHVVIEDGIENIGRGAFTNCTSLISVTIPPSVTTIEYEAFANCTNMKNYYFEDHKSVPVIRSDTFTNIPSNCSIYIPAMLYDSWSTDSVWSKYKSHFIRTGAFVDFSTVEDSYMVTYGNEIDISFVIESDSRPTVSTRVGNANLMIVTNPVITSSGNRYTVTFSISPRSSSASGSTPVMIEAIVEGSVYTKGFIADAAILTQPSFTFESLSLASYGFALNGSGYYESQNKGVNNSYAMCKITINNPSGYELFLDCINFAESSYDYGILGKVNADLSYSESADDVTIVQESFKSKQSASVQTVEYGRVRSGYIYIKFRKDTSTHRDNDSLQFKVRFGTTPDTGSSGSSLSGFIVTEVEGSQAYEFELNANGYYESTNQGMGNSYSLCRVDIINPSGDNVYFDCINSSEEGWDYGVLSVINPDPSCYGDLGVADGYDPYLKEEFNTSSEEIQTVDYGKVTYGFVYVKYMKDSTEDRDNDSLQFKVRFASDVPYTVSAVPEATGAYPFELNADGYYESTNQGVDGSYSLCKVDITNPNGLNVYFDCINYAENNWDFGILSNVGSVLSFSNSVDSTGVMQSFKGYNSASVKTVSYGAISGTIYVKYIKDGSANYNNDSFQFKIRME